MNTVLFHQLGNRLARYMMALGRSFGVDARRTMALLTVLEDRPDLADQHLETGRPFGAIRSSALPCMEPTSGNIQNPAPQANGMIVGKGCPVRDIASQCTVPLPGRVCLHAREGGNE
jgi:hypothetical protein